MPDIKHLTDEELTKYHALFKKLSNRAIDQKIRTYDSKFAYHVVRLLNEVEMILSEGTLDLQRNREQLKSIRRGDWSEQDILDYFSKKELGLEELYQSSKLRYAPDEEAIKALLLNCLEHHYGSLDKCVVKVGVAESYLDEISTIVDKWRIAQK